jgi:hypothetical protein
LIDATMKSIVGGFSPSANFQALLFRPPPGFAQQFASQGW